MGKILRVNPIALPRTNQTTSYNSGDDGDYEAGWPPSGKSRFVLISPGGDDIVYDAATGLFWMRDPINDYSSLFGSAQNWADTLADCENADFGGWTDWRMPNLIEMISLWQWQSSAPYVDSLFDNIQSNKAAKYWTSTTWPGTSGSAIALQFMADAFGAAATKGAYAWILPVRGGLIND